MTIDFPHSSQCCELRALWQEAFGDNDTWVDTFFSIAYVPDRCRCVTMDNRIAAALYWFDCTCQGVSFAYLYGIATARRWQSQGLCRALIDNTHTLLRHLGYHGTVLVPADQILSRMYARLGYCSGPSLDIFTATTGEQPTPLHQLDSTSYIQMRQRFLPPDAIAYGENYAAFLEQEYTLLAGENLLLAGNMEGSVFHAAEFLGNPAAAPAVLCTLGAVSGTFCTFGQGTAHAMFFPLTADCPVPSYLGAAFE